MHLLDLPDDILFYILTSLNDPNTIENLLFTCHKLRSLVLASIRYILGTITFRLLTNLSKFERLQYLKIDLVLNAPSNKEVIKFLTSLQVRAMEVHIWNVQDFS